MMRILLLIFLLIPHLALANDFEMSHFRQMPVLHEGRVKPIDSFAKIYSKALTGSQKNSDRLLADMLFNPGASIKEPLFRIDNDNLKHRLGLKNQKFYSFEELSASLQKTSPEIEMLLRKKNLTRDETDLLNLHNNAAAYLHLLRSFSLILPLNIYLPDQYKTGSKPPSYLELKKIEAEILSELKNIVRRKGEDLSKYNDKEKQIAISAYQIETINQGGQDNRLFRVLPSEWNRDEWLAPWELIKSGSGGPQTTKLMKLWSNLGKAWLDQDANTWNKTSRKLLTQTIKQSNLASWRFKLEVAYNQAHLTFVSSALLAAAFFFSLLFLTFNKAPFYRAGITALGAAAFTETALILTRSTLLVRPPVGTLYESLLFAGLIIAALAFVSELKRKDNISLLIGSLGSLFLYMLSFGFAEEGDSMTMLTAVLNTQFWLATHVLCVTAGYAWCIMAAFLAHAILLKPRLQNEFYAPLFTLSLFALLFMATGTILGGIWADQSWGRFWGWDPKENGALLICMWLIWAIHGKLGKQLDGWSFTAIIAGLNCLVAVSWIGVNLLGVGLHSYGFTDGLAAGLLAFIITECIVISYLWRKTRKLRA